jgi:probable H4MPT-linked C1 transfer pathway protein
MPRVFGWDIGGVNTKAAYVVEGALRAVATRPFELQRAPEHLTELLLEIASALAMEAGVAPVKPDTAATHAVTMTAELSQLFRTKRDGVAFVLDALEAAFPGASIEVYTTDGTFIAPAVARQQPLHVAAANWVATAHVVAQHHPNSLLIDVGTTTTDVIPIIGGRVAALGKTDPARLASGELVYSGAVRTPVEAIVREVPLANGSARVSAEAFALTGDVHVWLGSLSADDYDATTPDGRATTREYAGDRLARVVCADREMLQPSAITRIAHAVADEQVSQIAAAIRAIRERHPELETAVVTGLGAFVGGRAARAAGLNIVALSTQLGDAGARSAPAAAVALLLDRKLAKSGVGTASNAGSGLQPTSNVGAGLQLSNVRAGLQTRPRTEAHNGRPLTVIKLGGSLLANPAEWRAAIATIATTEADRIVIVPGGGPFADQVREIDAQLALTDSAAHWMAIAGMDQHAEMIATAHDRLLRVVDEAGVWTAHAGGEVPVIAPLQWLRAADPLPHAWDVTSDSIAAWLAGELGAARLILIKPAGISGPSSVDSYFMTALPAHLPWLVCEASGLAAQLQALEPARP